MRELFWCHVTFFKAMSFFFEIKFGDDTYANHFTNNI